MNWPVPTLKPEWKTTFFDDVVNVDVDDDDGDDVLFVLLSLLVSFVPANEVR